MTKLHRLHEGQGQSPWLDNLTRDHLRSGHLAGLVNREDRRVGDHAARTGAYAIFRDAFHGPRWDAIATGGATAQRGTVARTIDENAEVAAAILTRAADLVVDLADAGRALEDQGVASFTRSFAEVLARLQAKVVANA